MSTQAPACGLPRKFLKTSNDTESPGRCCQLGRGASLGPSVHSSGQNRQWVYCTLPPRNLTVIQMESDRVTWEMLQA